MEHKDENTIVAISSGVGAAGIGIVRLSGPRSLIISEKILSKRIKPRIATYSSFKDGDEILDYGVALYFKGPNSFNGEDIVELHGHGGNVIPNLLMDVCIKLGARLAEPGEFTKKAFINNKLDLIQAESISDLINASSKEAALGALRSLQGDFSKYLMQIKDDILRLRVKVESTIDFPEDDIDNINNKDIKEEIQIVLKKIKHIYEIAKSGNILRDGLKILILGEPNVGKSSLMNLLTKDETSIVSNISGTTRDLIKKNIYLKGVNVELIDSAGLSTTPDQIEKIGIEKAFKESESCDLIIQMTDITNYLKKKKETIPKIKNINTLHVINKIDLTSEKTSTKKDAVFISVKKNKNINTLISKIESIIFDKDYRESPFVARKRHIIEIKKSEKSLKKSLKYISYIELLAEEFRQAQISIEKITGETSNEKLLGEIFSTFCIGK